jgi:hypothetical protein
VFVINPLYSCGNGGNLSDSDGEWSSEDEDYDDADDAECAVVSSGSKGAKVSALQCASAPNNYRSTCTPDKSSLCPVLTDRPEAAVSRAACGYERSIYTARRCCVP